MNYYNEFEKYPAKWSRNLSDAGRIVEGIVDERDIREVAPGELSMFTQCHFFSGIGGWSHALRLAGWLDGWPVWTGSCPCQPFSNAGKGKGVKDERHLWPAFRWLIAQCRPATIFGEQVASNAGREWFAGVRADLEALGYDVGCADLCAAGEGAPHIRQRLFWVANTTSGGYKNIVERSIKIIEKDTREAALLRGSSGNCRLGHSITKGLEGHAWNGNTAGRQEATGSVAEASGDCRVGQSNGERSQPGEQTTSTTRHGGSVEPTGGDCGMADTGHIGPPKHEKQATGSEQHCPWAEYILIPCADGKARRIKPGIMPLAHGVSGRLELVRTRIKGGATIQETHKYSRVGAIKAYGNAIVPQVAATFIKSFMDCRTKALRPGEVTE